VASGCDFWLDGSVDSNLFPECPLSLKAPLARFEISQVAEFALQNTNGCLPDRRFAAILKRGANIRRLRQRCWNALGVGFSLGFLVLRKGNPSTL
jgi:hypothetical protein